MSADTEPVALGLERRQLARVLADLKRELATAKATRERFRLRFREAEAAIAKARRIIRRSTETSPVLDEVYAELSWRKR